MKIWQLNRHLADVVETNADYELGKFRRHIAADKYMLVNVSFLTKFQRYFSARKFSNRKNWVFYRALIWIFEEQDAIQTRSKKKIQ